MDDEQLQEMKQSHDFLDYVIYCDGDGDEDDKYDDHFQNLE